MATPKQPKFGGGHSYPPQNRQIPLYDEQAIQEHLQNVQKGNQTSQPLKATKKVGFGGNPEPKRKRGLLDFLFGGNEE